MIKESMVINVNNDLGNNVYYTIINKAQLNFKVNENERLETIQSKSVLKFMICSFTSSGMFLSLNLALKCGPFI